MSVSYELEREFREIGETKFWKEYQLSLQSARGILIRKLMRDVDISKIMTLGETWQKQIDLIDKILLMPDKIIGYENEDNPSSDDGTA
jgi:tRNA A37 methylthiotransferase MiaB